MLPSRTVCPNSWVTTTATNRGRSGTGRGPSVPPPAGLPEGPGDVRSSSSRRAPRPWLRGQLVPLSRTLSPAMWWRSVTRCSLAVLISAMRRSPARRFVGGTSSRCPDRTPGTRPGLTDLLRLDVVRLSSEEVVFDFDDVVTGGRRDDGPNLRGEGGIGRPTRQASSSAGPSVNSPTDTSGQTRRQGMDPGIAVEGGHRSTVLWTRPSAVRSDDLCPGALE